MAETRPGGFSSLIEYVPDASLLVDSSGRVAAANDAASELFGRAKSELVGVPLELLMPERFRDAHVAHRDKFMHAHERRGMGTNLALFLLRGDGREVPVDISLSPIVVDAQQFI